MFHRIHGLGVAVSALLASSAFAQTTFTEVEPNTNKTEATLANGMIAGDSLTGTTTGVVTTALSTLGTSVDYFRVKTAARGVTQMSRYARTMAVLYQTPVELIFGSDGTLRVAFST